MYPKLPQLLIKAITTVFLLFAGLLVLTTSTFAAGPVLTKDATSKAFKLDGVEISRFGIRAANALDPANSFAAEQRLTNNLDTLKSYGIQSVSISLQGAKTGTANAFDSTGHLKADYKTQITNILNALQSRNMVAVVSYFYQVRDQDLVSDDAVRTAISEATTYIKPWRNVWLYVINEPGHSGFDRTILKSGHTEIKSIIKGVDPDRITYVSPSVNDGFTSGTGTTANNGNVVVEYVRQDLYFDENGTPGVFTTAQQTQAQNDATTTFNNKGYWFWHAAWHQQVSGTQYPHYDKGGTGTSGSPGVAFIWDKMQQLSGGGGSPTPSSSAIPLPSPSASPSQTPSSSPTPYPSPSSSPFCTFAGDTNCDNALTLADLTNLLTKYLTNDLNSDIDRSGKVNVFDAGTIIKSLPLPSPTVTPTGSSTPLPLPSGGAGIAPIKVATGAYPDITTDASSNVHLVYARDGKLWYKKFVTTTGSWTTEEDTGITQNASYRNDPEIAVDAIGTVHVLGGLGNSGGQYAYRSASGWTKIGTFNRDTGIAVDNTNTVYVVERDAATTGGYIGLYKRVVGATAFTKMADPDIANGLPLGENDHVYANICTNMTDNSVHVAYRHGAPTKFAYRGSDDGGLNWYGGGVSTDDAEAPNCTVSGTGVIYAVGGNGTVFQRTGKPSSWLNLGLAVSALPRYLPSLATDTGGNLYVSSFAGKYNTRLSGAIGWTGEKTLPKQSSGALGFAEVAPGSGNYAFVVWEEGNSNPSLDTTTAAFDIYFATINKNGVIGSN